MDSVDNKILESLKKRGMGGAFTKDEYAHYANPKRVQNDWTRVIVRIVLP